MRPIKGSLNMLAVSLCLFIYLGFSDAYAQFTITGNVTDANTGESLIGVTIIIGGTHHGTITDIDGNYSISVPGNDAVLVFSYIGYGTEMITVGDQRNIDISMNPALSELGEVVITGQARGQQRAMYEQIQSVTLKNVVAPDRPAGKP